MNSIKQKRKKTGAVLLALALAGSSAWYFTLDIRAKQQLKTAINNDEAMLLSPAIPLRALSTNQAEQVDWVSLDKKKSYPEFREKVDKALGITTFGDTKVGCAYVNFDNAHEGNSNLKFAMLNRHFNEKILDDIVIREKLSIYAKDIYSDIQNESQDLKVLAALDAYFDISGDGQADEFGANKLVSRAQFMSMLTRANEQVTEVKESDIKDYEASLGGSTAYSKCMMWADENEIVYLNRKDRSLSLDNANTEISRLEAMYAAYRLYVKDTKDTTQVTTLDTSDVEKYSDLVGAAPISKELGLQTDQTVYKKYKPYILSYAFKHPDKEVESELYYYTMRAKKLGINNEEELRWDEALTKAEAIELIVNTYSALYKNEGARSTIGNAKVESAKPSEAVEVINNGKRYAVAQMDLSTGQTKLVYVDTKEEYDAMAQQYVKDAEKYFNSSASSVSPEVSRKEELDKIAEDAKQVKAEQNIVNGTTVPKYGSLHTPEEKAQMGTAGEQGYVSGEKWEGMGDAPDSNLGFH